MSFFREFVILTQYLKCTSIKSKCTSRGRAYTTGDTTYRVALCCFAHYGPARETARDPRRATAAPPPAHEVKASFFLSQKYLSVTRLVTSSAARHGETNLCDTRRPLATENHLDAGAGVGPNPVALSADFRVFAYQLTMFVAGHAPACPIKHSVPNQARRAVRAVRNACARWR